MSKKLRSEANNLNVTARFHKIVVLRAIITIVPCDQLAALGAKIIVMTLFNLLSSRRHANVTETPTLTGV
jgi:hypothetical protein